MNDKRRKHDSSHEAEEREASIALQLLRRAVASSSLTDLPNEIQPCSSTISTHLAGNQDVVALPAAPASLFIHHSPLPTLEQLASSSNPRRSLRAMFLADLREGDMICAKVVRCGVGVLELEAVCMLARFRRCIEAFMQGEKFPVLFDRARRIYCLHDYVRSYVKDTDPLSLSIDEDEKCTLLCRWLGYPTPFTDIEATLKLDDLPRYYRNWCDNGRHPHSTYRDDEAIAKMRYNPNLAVQLCIDIDPHAHSTVGLQTGPSETRRTAEEMRREQTHNLAMEHVKRGASLTREGKCFEATQLFNKALAVDENCVDAYVGRGAACAGDRNFEAALADFERALQLDSLHKNASKYRIEVLLAFGKDLEKAGSLDKAREKYTKASELSGGKDPRAFAALRRLVKASTEKEQLWGVSSITVVPSRSRNEIELINLDEEEDYKFSHQQAASTASGGNGNAAYSSEPQGVEEIGKAMADSNERERNSIRLREMEEFIAKLKAPK